MTMQEISKIFFAIVISFDEIFYSSEANIPFI